jgi:hypothetical protein
LDYLQKKEIKKKLKGHDQTQSDILIRLVDVENTNIWFTLNPMGKSKLGDLVRTMAEKAALDGRKVNHSARKRCQRFSRRPSYACLKCFDRTSWIIYKRRKFKTKIKRP